MGSSWLRLKRAWSAFEKPTKFSTAFGGRQSRRKRDIDCPCSITNLSNLRVAMVHEFHQLDEYKVSGNGKLATPSGHQLLLVL